MAVKTWSAGFSGKPVWEQEIIAEAEAKRARRGERSNATNWKTRVPKEQDPRAERRRLDKRARKL